MKTQFVGIDPGVQTGFAIWDKEARRFSVVMSCSIVQVMDTLLDMKDVGIDFQVRFEDARLRTWFGKEKGVAQLQGAGSIKRDCHIWEQFCEYHGIQYLAIAPKNVNTKLTSKLFKGVTKWDRLTNEHGRDAAMLVFGL